MAGRLFRGVLTVAFGAVLLAIGWAERRRPLRGRVEPGFARISRNLAIGGIAGLTTAATELPLIPSVQRWAWRRRIGVLHWLPLPPRAHAVLAFLLLDYTLFLWHKWNHRVAALWRFHLVHHIDLDMDSTTGVRFHAGELALATLYRAGQVIVIGVDASTLRLWQRLLFLSVIFHHSNLRLPFAVERRLVRWFVTPRMHGVHHSIVVREQDSNFSSLLSCWDLLHRTLRLDVPQDAIVIGVEGFARPADVTLARVLALPFTSHSGRSIES